MKYHHLLEKQIETLSAQHRYDPTIQQFLQLVDQSYKNLESQQKQAEKMICRV